MINNKYSYFFPYSTLKFYLISIAFFIISFKLFLLLQALIVGGVYLFRKSLINTAPDNIAQKNILFSPVNGKVTKIKKSESGTKMTMKLSVFSGFGIQLPFNSIVESISDEKNTRILKLNNEELGSINIQLKSMNKAFSPQLISTAGDRGESGADIGYLPFGGKIVIDLPQDFNVLVNEGEVVKSNQTLISSKEIIK